MTSLEGALSFGQNRDKITTECLSYSWNAKMKVLVNELSYFLRKKTSNWSSAIRGNGSHAEFLDLTSQPDTGLVQLQYIIRFSKKRPLIFKK